MERMEFEDGAGRVWSVWEAHPKADVSVPEPYAGGWLCFDSVRERRRLAPVPAHWRYAPLWRLRILLELATLNPVPLAALD